MDYGQNVSSCDPLRITLAETFKQLDTFSLARVTICIVCRFDKWNILLALFQIEHSQLQQNYLQVL